MIERSCGQSPWSVTELLYVAILYCAVAQCNLATEPSLHISLRHSMHVCCVASVHVLMLDALLLPGHCMRILLCNVFGIKTHMLQCLQMLMDLGPVVYVEDFEKHFLAKASEFYQVMHANEDFALTRPSSSNKRCLLPCANLPRQT